MPSIARLPYFLVSRRDNTTDHKSSISIVNCLEVDTAEELPLLDVLDHCEFEYDGCVFCTYGDASEMLAVLEHVDLIDQVHLAGLVDLVCRRLDKILAE